MNSMDEATCHLTPENAIIAKDALKADPLNRLSKNDTWIRWWNEGNLQLDGDMTLGELKALVAVMEQFK